MASFLPDLWSSIFTPGPTPTLLIATNATFAALQVLLAALLCATYSPHFAALSLISAALWASINWFARELAASQQQQQQTQTAEGAEQPRSKSGETLSDRDRRSDDGIKPDGDDGRVDDERSSGESLEVPASGGRAATTGVSGGSGQIQQRRRIEDMERSGEISTDSEWEKVSQEGDR